MTTPQAPAVRANAQGIEGLDEALAQMKALGIAEGHKAGYAQGRIDAGAILTSEAAKGREGFAAKLAADPDIKTERALSLLAEVPEAKVNDGTLDRLMKMRDPAIGAGPAQAENAQSARLADIQAAAKAANLIRR